MKVESCDWIIRYCSRIAQTATDFADASHSKSAKSASTAVSYGIFSSENAYPCTVTMHQIWGDAFAKPLLQGCERSDKIMTRGIIAKIDT